MNQARSLTTPLYCWLINNEAEARRSWLASPEYRWQKQELSHLRSIAVQLLGLHVSDPGYDGPLKCRSIPKRLRITRIVKQPLRRGGKAHRIVHPRDGYPARCRQVSFAFETPDASGEGTFQVCEPIWGHRDEIIDHIEGMEASLTLCERAADERSR